MPDRAQDSACIQGGVHTRSVSTCTLEMRHVTIAINTANTIGNSSGSIAMPQNLTGCSFLKLLDFTPAQIRALLLLARDLKAAKRAGTEQPRLSGKNIALIFEKHSTRTRSGFEVVARDQGAHVTYIGP